MSKVETYIKAVNTKLQELLKNYASLKKENQKLNEELSMLHQQQKENKDIINILNQKVNILQAASGQMSEKDQKEFEKRINIYLREIDKCINMLSE